MWLYPELSVEISAGELSVVFLVKKKLWSHIRGIYVYFFYFFTLCFFQVSLCWKWLTTLLVFTFYIDISVIILIFFYFLNVWTKLCSNTENHQYRIYNNHILLSLWNTVKKPWSIIAIKSILASVGWSCQVLGASYRPSTHPSAWTDWLVVYCNLL